jgi:hypothetical protein
MITNQDDLVNALANNASRLIIDKASTAGAAGTLVSMWRATGQPGQGAIPTTGAVCNNNLLGAMGFTQQTAPATSYAGYAQMSCTNNASTIEIHDRLMHMGGLNGTLTTAQGVALDLFANLAVSNLDARKGDANYSDVQWWVEWYTATGGTAANLTVNVTYDDGSIGNLTTVALAATRPASLMIPLNQQVPAAQSGRFIRAINTATLSATTGTAGNFGFTATRFRTVCSVNVANKTEVFNAFDLGLPNIDNGACLFPVCLMSTTTTGIFRGNVKLAHG